MPRGRLNERYVQEAGLAWLQSYYQDKARVVLPELEVAVSSKTKLGYGRADGLIVAQMLNGVILTAAMEAKSSKTLSNLSWWYKDGSLLLHTLLVSGCGTVVAAFVGWLIGHWFWTWVFPFLAFAVTGFVYLRVMGNHSAYRTIDVITQVKHYPADEQWIALSTDAYNLLYGDERQSLHAACKREGVGLIRVGSGARVKLLESPKTRCSPEGHTDFLACYARSATIRRKLQAKAEEIADDKSNGVS